MAYRKAPLLVALGGTGSTTASAARTALSVPLNTNTMLLDGTQNMAANLNMGSNRIVSLANPVSATDAVNLQTLQSYIVGMTNTTARVATTGTSYTLASACPNTLDGVSLVANDTILVKDQATPSQNGLYTVTTLGSGANGVWTRASNFSTTAQIQNSWIVYIDEGTANGSTAWMFSVDPDNLPTLGTTSIVWTQFSGLGDVTAGNGLSKNGNTLSVQANGTTINVSASGIKVSDTYPGNTSLATLGTVTTGTWSSSATNIAVNAGGTGAASASSARTNLAAAPNTASFWVGASNGELGSGIVPSQGTGITLNAAAGTVAVDTTVVATTSNSLTMSSKTLTTPNVNNPVVVRTFSIKTASYQIVAGDDVVSFNISSGANATLPVTSGLTNGRAWVIKNKAGSTANVTIITNLSGDVLENVANGTFTLYPGDSVEVLYDGVEFIVF